LTEDAAEYAKRVFRKIGGEYDTIIDTMEIVEDHVHMFLEAPPRLSPSHIVQILKSTSAREMFGQFPRLDKELWVGGYGAMATLCER